jgi:hypothetical protein
LAAVVVKPARAAVIGVDDALVALMVADTCDLEALPLPAFPVHSRLMSS